MQMGEGRPKSTPPSPLIGYNAKVGEFNEQILRLMQSLGINQQKTMEVSFQGNFHEPLHEKTCF